MLKIAKYILPLLLLCIPALRAGAQFKEEAFSQTYNDENDSTYRDSTDVMFSLREYFGGLAHKNECKVGSLMVGSMVFVGGMQVYNRDYWKLPLVYGGIGGTMAAGFIYRNKWKDTAKGRYQHISNYCFLGAGLVYWATLMDGVTSYGSRDDYPHPGKATLYSLLVPGLGQAYLGDYWRIPIYYAGLLISADCLITNSGNYKRFKRIYKEATTDGSGYSESISASTALYYRDLYRRYRDYSLLALIGVYVLQIIDANIFTYMHDFEITDDISMRVEPTIISDDFQYAAGVSGGRFPYSGTNSVGLKLGISF